MATPPRTIAVTSAERTLDRCVPSPGQPDLRGWEWHYLKGLFNADLLTLGTAAMKSAVFRSIVDLRTYDMTKGQGHAAHWWGNSNDLIGRYPGAVGIKTGYTVSAAHCLLFEAVRGGRPLLGVVLASPPAGPAAGAQDAARILNWAFTLKQSP